MAGEPRYPHNWGTTRVGHGVMQCNNCTITFMEAVAIGCVNSCDKHPARPRVSMNQRAGVDFPCALHKGPAGDCDETNCRCHF